VAPFYSATLVSSYSALDRFAREGQIQGIHIGKLWRFRQSALEKWIERQTGTKARA
jgi:excisionase family DNA binding protein